MGKDALIGVLGSSSISVPRQMGFPPGKVFAEKASSTELTPFHAEVSFAFAIYFLNHFHQLVSVIVGLRASSLAEHIRAGGDVFLNQHRVKAARKNTLALTY